MFTSYPVTSTGLSTREAYFHPVKRSGKGPAQQRVRWFLHEAAHSKVYVVFYLCKKKKIIMRLSNAFFVALSTLQSKMQYSLPILERKETSQKLISPKLNQYSVGEKKCKYIVFLFVLCVKVSSRLRSAPMAHSRTSKWSGLPHQSN